MAQSLKCLACKDDDRVQNPNTYVKNKALQCVCNLGTASEEWRKREMKADEAAFMGGLLASQSVSSGFNERPSKKKTKKKKTQKA